MTVNMLAYKMCAGERVKPLAHYWANLGKRSFRWSFCYPLRRTHECLDFCPAHAHFYWGLLMTVGSLESTKTVIWTTAHSRMIAEKRHRTYDTVSSLLLSWLSLSVIVWATVRSSQPTTALLDTYTAIISAFVFAFSIITFGFRFGEIAALHRECYLRLQKLHDSEIDAEKLISGYHEILGAYRNHDDCDYAALVIERTLYNRKEMWDSNDNEVKWTGLMLVKHASRAIAFWSVAMAVFLLGAVPYVLILRSI